MGWGFGGWRRRPTLPSRGLAHGVTRSSRRYRHLGLHQDALTGHSPHHIVLILDRWPVTTANVMAEHYDQARVTVFLAREPSPRQLEVAGDRVVVEHAATIADLHTAITAGPAPDVVIDGGTHPDVDRVELFRSLFLHLVPGGRYVVEATSIRGGAEVVRVVDALAAAADDAAPSVDSEEFAASVAGLQIVQDVAYIARRGSHVVLLRPIESEAAIRGRYGPDRVERLMTVTPTSFTTEGLTDIGRPEFARRFRTSFDVPELGSWAYRDVVCAPRQISLVGTHAPTTTFHQPWRWGLQLSDGRMVARHFAQIDLAEPRTLPGTFFHLDNQFPSHYGHFTTQDLAKLWAWDDARARWPDIRLLVSAAGRETSLKEYQYELLGLWGIGRDDITVLTDPVRVERLVAATQLLQQPVFASPLLVQTWDRLCRAAEAAVPDGAAVDRLFVSRDDREVRRCTNRSEVEWFFTHRGFQVVHPERLPVTEQIALFSRARTIAGFAGSGLLNLVYARTPGRRIVIASESYTAANEQMIAAIRGHDIHYVWGTPQVPQPDDEWSEAAFHADYWFDIPSHTERLDHILAQP